VAYEYELLRVEVDRGVAFASIDNPPINLMTIPLFLELARLADEAGDDPEVRALVLRSANPEFFIAHFDVEAILGFPTDEPPRREAELNGFHAMCERYRTMPKATIVQLEGRVGGGGSELISSCDMRFGARGRAVLSQPEVAIGILPGGSGTQRLPRLLGRGRALEVILGCDDVDAETAERWGWLNRVLPPEELGPFVQRLAYRIGSFPAGAIARAKASALCAEPSPREGLIEEAFLFQETLHQDEAQQRMRRFLEIGGQTRKGELRLQELCEELRV
jgi:enoyl-CoA hydratase/carnithine racemase